MNSQRNNHEGYEDVISQLTSLISAYPPPFIYIHDPATPRLVASAIGTALGELQKSSDLELRYALVDAVLCFNARILYDTILNDLAQWTPTWEDGCSNWGAPSALHNQRFNESFDAFAHGLRAIHSSLQTEMARTAMTDKGKAPDHQPRDRETRLIICIERAERLKESMPDLLTPLTRLAELVCELVPP